MTTTRKAKSFVVSYNEADDKLTVCSLFDSDIAPFVERALTADWPLSSVNHELNDEVAQRLGATALSILAVNNPTLKRMLKVTLEAPEPPPAD